VFWFKEHNRIANKSAGTVLALETMTTRICTKCGKEKDIIEFSWSIRGIKRHSRCKACHAKERSLCYERHKEKELEYKRDRQQRKKEEARRAVVL
jgi:hypothetical protein